jgi:hypothetical protein
MMKSFLFKNIKKCSILREAGIKAHAKRVIIRQASSSCKLTAVGFP